MVEEIKNYLYEVTKYIYDENEAEKVKEELTDHIYNLHEEYISRGLSEDEATIKALANMGSAKKIGRELNSSYISKKSKIRVLVISISLVICLISIGFEFRQTNSTFLKICCLIEIICVFISSGTFFYGMYNKVFGKYNSKVLYQIRSVKNPSTYQAIGEYFIWFYIILIGFATIINMHEGEFASNWTLVFFLIQVLILRETYDTGATICEEGLIVGHRFVKWEQINSHMWLSSYSKDKSMSELKFNLNNKKGKASLRQTLIKVRKQQKDDIGKIINDYLN